jgi:hypothetical protein
LERIRSVDDERYATKTAAPVEHFQKIDADDLTKVPSIALSAVMVNINGNKVTDQKVFGQSAWICGQSAD